ncbi:PAS domain-containing protein [Paenibacillus methanolicus]|uniref:PAS domain S-box-containing protein/diguanylate cyclase (GGDEF)-like protein n=1 Tax=Paenibacillus methanolicus TaxID=582686 RepID=A0A5S5C8T4_9BACL|nr:PAS domain-containing protein [Paenibacillus methanolicus]TYP75589.1 PAS domain S-box-containing protein/diguanylate cyclase (GGDEF)-like protein [Paenibacillus methanolicus]
MNRLFNRRSRPNTLHRKFRRQMMLLVLSVAITCMAVFTYIEYDHHREKALDQLKQTVMLEHAFLEKWLAERMGDIHILAHSQSVKSLDENAMRGDLQQVLAGRKEFSYITFVNKDGIGDLHGKTTNLTDREYYQEGKLLKETISGTLISKYNGKPVIIFASPITDKNNEFAGLITGAVELTTIEGLMKQFQYGTDGESYLVALDGTMITGTRLALGEMMETPLTQAAASGHQLTESYANYDGREVYGAYAWTNNGRWLIVAETGIEVVLKSIYAQLIMTALIILIALLAAAYASSRVAAHLSRPIEELLRGVRGIQNGQYGYVIDAGATKDSTVELDELLQVYNGMSVTLGKTVEKLQVEQAFADSVLNTAASFIIVLDHEGRVVRFNQACETLSGHTADEARGRPLHELQSLPKEREDIRLHMEHFARTGEVIAKFEQRWEAWDGRIHWVAWSNATMKDASGRVQFVIATGIDITEQRRAQRELAKNEERFRSLVNSIDETITIFDEDMRVSGMFGRPVQDLLNPVEFFLGKSLDELLPSEAAEPHKEALRQAFAGEPSVQEWALKTAAGGMRYYITSYSPFIQTDGRITGIVSVGREVTEFKQVQEAYMKSEAWLKNILESITDTFAVVDREWRFTYVNQEAERYLGRTAEQLTGRVLWDLYPGIAASPFGSAYRKAMSEQVKVSFEEFSELYNAWFETHIYPSKEGLTVYLRNVNERKGLEQTVEEAKDRLDTIIETVPNGILVFDDTGAITLANHMAEQMLGIQVGGGSGDAASFCLWNLADRGGVRFGEEGPPFLRVIRDGKPMNNLELSIHQGEKGRIIVSCNAAPFKNKQGEVNGVLVSLTDISKRVKSETELQKANDSLVRLSSMDGLTSVYNRRYFDAQTEAEWAKRTGEDGGFAIALLDIDCFKMYNDNYGHQGGDTVLKRVAQLAHDMLVLPGSFVARYGGEEFACVLPGASERQALELAEAIRARVEASRIPHAKSTVSRYVTVSMGVAAGAADSWEELVAAADLALYEAKRTRNSVAAGHLQGM